MCKKIPLAAIKLRAGYIASATTRERVDVTQDLIDAHRAHGIEIDYSGSGDLIFTSSNFDPEKTQPLPVKESE